MIIVVSRMDSYVLAEMFKYLFLLFAEKEDLVLDIDDFLFTTEAHLLPLTLSIGNITKPTPKVKNGFSGISVGFFCFVFLHWHHILIPPHLVP
jgi:hypothetical protein